MYICIPLSKNINLRDAQKTKQSIIIAASVLFNTQGYKATSLSDITKATKLTKGAIYRHFKDKSDLEKEALLYMCNILRFDLRDRIKSQKTTKTKLNTIMEYFQEYSVTPPFVGGCPLMNAAIESDDTDPKLKAVAKEIMLSLHSTIVSILKNGKKHNEVRSNYNAEEFASLIIGSLEGGVMIMKVSDDSNHLRSVINFIKKEIDNLN